VRNATRRSFREYSDTTRRALSVRSEGIRLNVVSDRDEKVKTRREGEWFRNAQNGDHVGIVV
jgi:hypothetical protein